MFRAHVVTPLLGIVLLASSCGWVAYPDTASTGTAVTGTSTSTIAAADSAGATDSANIVLPSLKTAPLTRLIDSADSDEIDLPTVTTVPIENDATPQPTPTTLPLPGPTSSDETTLTTIAVGEELPTPFPTVMAAIRGSEELLLINTTTGASSVIVRFSLIVDAENQIGPQFPFSVDVDPVSVGLRYDTCCDPDASLTRLIDLATGTEMASVDGALPSVSPDGAMLAVSHVSSIDIVATATGTTASLTRTTGTWFVGRTSWSPDGSTLAVEVQSPGSSAPFIALIDAEARSLDDARILAPPDGTAWTLPSFRSDGAIVFVETTLGTNTTTRIAAIDATSGGYVETVGLLDIDSILDIDHDASGQWLLIVDGDGDAFWFGADSAGRLPGQGYSSASW